MRITQRQLFENQAVTVDGYSQAFDLKTVTGYSIQATWTGTLSGNLFIQISDDRTPVNEAPTNWVTLTAADGSAIVPMNGAPGIHIWKQALASYRFVRLGVMPSGGSGNLSAILTCKGHD